MQLFLFAAFILIVNILWCGVSANECSLSRVLLSCGYGQDCVYSSLKACEIHGAPTPNECSLKEDLISHQENITTTLMEVKTLLQEVKMEQMKEKNCDVSKTSTQKVKIGPWKNCADLRVLGDELSEGVQTVYPYFPNPNPVVVYCDQVTDGGGWTVIQRRSPLPVRESFERPWQEYVEGFGDPSGEFWLGLDNIHTLTNSAQMELRVDLEDWEGAKAFAQYGTFYVGPAAFKYILSIGNFSGDAGEGMIYPSEINWNLNGNLFSTYDNDNDRDSERNCANLYRGGWWYNKCYAAYLNGLPFVGKTPNDGGIHWKPFREWNQLKETSMKIRPVSLGS